jgi:hypothetical protein
MEAIMTEAVTGRTGPSRDEASLDVPGRELFKRLNTEQVTRDDAPMAGRRQCYATYKSQAQKAAANIEVKPSEHEASILESRRKYWECRAQVSDVVTLNPLVAALDTNKNRQLDNSERRAALARMSPMQKADAIFTAQKLEKAIEEERQGPQECRVSRGDRISAALMCIFLPIIGWILSAIMLKEERQNLMDCGLTQSDLEKATAEAAKQDKKVWEDAFLAQNPGQVERILV